MNDEEVCTNCIFRASSFGHTRDCLEYEKVEECPVYDEDAVGKDEDLDCYR